MEQNQRFKLNIFEIILVLVNIMTTIFVGVQTKANIQLANITALKYEQENRPYVYIDSIDWLGTYNDFLKINIKNPSNFPANVSINFIIKDLQDTELMEEDRENIAVFPYEADKAIFVGYRKLQLSSKDAPNRKLIIQNKEAINVIDRLNSGEKLTMKITIEYSALIQKSDSLVKNFFYEQEFTIDKNDIGSNIKASRSKAN